MASTAPNPSGPSARVHPAPKTFFAPSIWESSRPTPDPPTYLDQIRSLRTYLPSDPAALSALSAVGAAGATLLGVRGYRRYCKRIRNSDYVTSGMLDRGRWVRGVVTSVGDGDNFRLFHTPVGYRWPLKLRSVPDTPKALKNETLHIRIAGVDAPEAAHFGNPAQPHSAESLAWLRDTVLGRRMTCKLLRKDQYNRVVAVPYIHRMLLPNKPLPLMMLKEGMAVVYTSGGAEYGKWGLERMQALEAEAKRHKRGLWSRKRVELPSDYKKRIKAGEDAPVAKTKSGGGENGWWSWLPWWK